MYPSNSIRIKYRDKQRTMRMLGERTLSTRQLEDNFMEGMTCERGFKFKEVEEAERTSHALTWKREGPERGNAEIQCVRAQGE